MLEVRKRSGQNGAAEHYEAGSTKQDGKKEKREQEKLNLFVLKLKL